MSDRNLNLGAVWITRTEPSASQTAKQVKKLGFTPLVAPLLILSAPQERPRLPEAGARLIFTSKNGIDAFCKYFTARNYSVLTVGEASAAYARAAGFKDVETAQGTSDSIPDQIIVSTSNLTPIIHCAGKHVRGAVVETLVAAGFNARRDLYYRSQPVSELPDLSAQAIRAVLLHSPLAAQTLATLSPDLSDARLISISQATDDALGSLACKARIIAAHPTEAEMLAGLLT